MTNKDGDHGQPENSYQSIKHKQVLSLKQPASHLKAEAFTQFAFELRHDTSSESICVTRKGKQLDLGLINFYKDTDFMNTFPDMWTDWENRIDSKLMIIGQDWGPFEEMKKVRNAYLEFLSQNLGIDVKKAKKQFLAKPPSRTSAFLIKALQKSVELENINIHDDFIDDIFITMSVLHARKGEHFRGTHNFDEVISAQRSRPFLQKQIEIVKPQVIVPLGNLALTSLSQIFGFHIEKNLTATIKSLEKSHGVIQVNKDGLTTTIIPAFHPASHISLEEKLRPYRTIWKYIT